jgi:hypothetical protein
LYGSKNDNLISITPFNNSFFKKISLGETSFSNVFISYQFNTNAKIRQNFSSLLSDLTRNSTHDEYLFNHDNFFEVTRWTKKTQGTINPLRVIKYNLNNLDFQNQDTNLFKIRFNDHPNDFKPKPVSHNNFLVLKQKRYKPLKNVPLRTKMSRDKLSYKNTSNVKYSGKLTLLNNSIFLEDELNSTIRYKQLKKFKKQTETITGPL